jgi:Na+/melibiose symporter-like transporter
MSSSWNENGQQETRKSTYTNKRLDLNDLSGVTLSSHSFCLYALVLHMRDRYFAVFFVLTFIDVVWIYKVLVSYKTARERTIKTHIYSTRHHLGQSATIVICRLKSLKLILLRVYACHDCRLWEKLKKSWYLSHSKNFINDLYIA